MIGNEKTIESAKEADARKENYVYYVRSTLRVNIQKIKPGLSQDSPDFVKSIMLLHFLFS